MEPLYRTALGQDFDALPPLLQRFHSQTGQAWEGEAVVRWSERPWLRLLLWLGRLPAPGLAVPVAVKLAAYGQGERWLRRFAGRLMASRQFMVGKHLHEGFGPLRLKLENRLDEAGVLWQRSSASHWLGLPLPKLLAAAVVASERHEAGRLCFDVAITLGGLDFIHYQGWLKPVGEHGDR
ncbi:DUF4166 domain-containing protein [Chitinimonas sp.]|uniref:DUF4166 domain-containing protein n=1 Tax=Chitinimonas sp. TaxID=1934313 RepID=UPI002F955768